MLSVIIPSRSDQFLQATIDDLLAKAEGEVEIIVALDGYWPNPMPRDDPRVAILHHGMLHENVGMRGGINASVGMARGEYLMKIDEHCMLDQGYDKKLMADCQDDWLVIPRRYRLDAENWTLVEDGRAPVDYMYLTYPFARPDDVLYGLHGTIWSERQRERKDVLIDDTMSWQGSCWFTKKKYWDQLFPDGLDDKSYGPFTQEAQEIGNKVWLSGGRLVVNKKTWYAHYHKGKRGKNLGFSNNQYKIHQANTEKGRRHCIEYWINNKWDKRTHDFEWLIEKFWPVPTWPDDWQDQLKQYREKGYSAILETEKRS